MSQSTIHVFRRIHLFLRLPLTRKRLLLRAAFELSKAWWIVRHHEFKDYARALGTVFPGEHIEPTERSARLFAQEIRWALKTLNRFTEGRATCLMLAIAGKRLLNREKIPNSLVLGVNPNHGAEGDPMGAHAWLRVGTYVVSGREQIPGHIPVASYVSANEAQNR